MIEAIDNTLQLAVTAGCAIWAGALAVHRKSQRFTILACFYGTFALGLLYWLLFLVLRDYTPQFFYVSDLSWVASFLFLLLLCFSLVQPGERDYRPVAAWLVLALLLVLTAWLCSFGDYINTLIWCLLLTGCGVLSTRGLLYARRQVGEGRRLQYPHAAILFITFAEFTLWLLSCYFKTSLPSNPYFWCDFALSLGMLALLPAMKKGVEA